MAEKRHEGGVSYHIPGKDYFEQRELRRHAGVFSLWALGVAAVISGDFSGWNLGFAVGGWGGMFVGTIIITIMYLGLTYSIAEMSPALPHTGGAYSFARTAFGPWGGFITGIAENIEYVLTPAVIVYFIGTYLTAIFETPAAFQPLWWILGYIVFVGLNARGVELSFIGHHHRRPCSRSASSSSFSSAPFRSSTSANTRMNIGADPSTGAAVELPDGHGPFLPFGVYGVLASLPFAVWLFLAIEQLPLAAEESADPQARHAEGHHARHVHADRAGLPRSHLQPGDPDPTRGDRRCRRIKAPSTAPSRSARRASRSSTASAPFSARTRRGRLALLAVTGLVASFHAIIFAYGRQIYSLSRAGYFPHFLSVTHGTHKTPNVALVPVAWSVSR